MERLSILTGAVDYIPRKRTRARVAPCHRTRTGSGPTLPALGESRAQTSDMDDGLSRIHHQLNTTRYQYVWRRLPEWSLVLNRSGSPRPRVSRENKEMKPTETITFFSTSNESRPCYGHSFLKNNRLHFPHQVSLSWLVVSAKRCWLNLSSVMLRVAQGHSGLPSLSHSPVIVQEHNWGIVPRTRTTQSAPLIRPQLAT